MTARLVTALVAALAVMAGAIGGVCGRAAASPALESFLAGLPAAIAAADSADGVRAVAAAAPADVTLADTASFDSTPLVRMQFPAVPANWLSTAWQLVRPYAVATDPHQLTWRLGVYQQDVPDPYATRVVVSPIRFGRWIVSPLLDGRPPGALPDAVAGASPAYDLGRYPASVVGIDVVGEAS